MSARLRSLNEKVDDLSESCAHRYGKGDS